jgi:hypothetical protein
MIKGGLGGLMKQAQMMQENMKKAQEQLAQIEVEGQAGAGMVKVVMTCATMFAASASILRSWMIARCWKTSLLPQSMMPCGVAKR